MVYRSRLSAVTAGVVVLFAAIFFVDTALRGSARLQLTALPALIAIAVAAWALLYRPCLRVREDASVLVGPLREITLPHAAVRNVRVRAVIVFDVEHRSYAAWVGPERSRRPGVDDRAEEAVAFIRTQLAAGPAAAPVRVRWLWAPWAVCAGCALASVAGFFLS